LKGAVSLFITMKMSRSGRARSKSKANNKRAIKRRI